MLPSSSDLLSMGYTYRGEPFIEIDAFPGLTSPGQMGLPYRGEPVTFAPLAVVPPPDYRRVNVKINTPIMGIKRPHLP